MVEHVFEYFKKVQNITYSCHCELFLGNGWKFGNENLKKMVWKFKNHSHEGGHFARTKTFDLN